MKIVIEIDYEPNMDSYPPEVKTKEQAALFDVKQINDGEADLEMLLEFDSVIKVIDDDGDWIS